MDDTFSKVLLKQTQQGWYTVNLERLWQHTLRPAQVQTRQNPSSNKGNGNRVLILSYLWLRTEYREWVSSSGTGSLTCSSGWCGLHPSSGSPPELGAGPSSGAEGEVGTICHWELQWQGKIIVFSELYFFSKRERIWSGVGGGGSLGGAEGGGII